MMFSHVLIRVGIDAVPACQVYVNAFTAIHPPLSFYLSFFLWSYVSLPLRFPFSVPLHQRCPVRRTLSKGYKMASYRQCMRKTCS